MHNNVITMTSRRRPHGKGPLTSSLACRVSMRRRQHTRNIPAGSAAGPHPAWRKRSPRGRQYTAARLRESTAQRSRRREGRQGPNTRSPQDTQGRTSCRRASTCHQDTGRRHRSPVHMEQQDRQTQATGMARLFKSTSKSNKTDTVRRLAPEEVKLYTNKCPVWI